MRKRLLGAASVAVGLAFIAASCGDDSGGSSSGKTECKSGTVKVDPIPTLQADGKGKSVGLLYDVTGRGDKSFNDAAAAALDKAKTDFGVTGNESTPTAADGSDRPERIKSFVGKNDLIVAVGFLWGDATSQSATENATQKYAIVDSVVNTWDTAKKAQTTTLAPNVRSMVFAEHQGSALVGAAAACATKTGTIGFIGGVENDLIKKFEAGYIAGAKAVNPDIKVVTKYITQPPDFSGFNDPAKGKAIGAQMITEGADVIYAAAGGSGKGLFTAAVESGKKPGDLYVIGVDSDQYLTASDAEKPFILTSMLKRVDVAVYNAIQAQLTGTLKGEVLTNDLKNNGISYSGSNKDIEKYAGTVEEIKQKILAGTLTVPEKPAA